MEWLVIGSLVSGVALVVWLLTLHASPGKQDLARAWAGRAVLICAASSIALGILGWWGPSKATTLTQMNAFAEGGRNETLTLDQWTATLVMSTYKAAQHILLNADANEQNNWILQVSRVLAIITITLLAIEAISRLFAEPIRRFQLWRMRGHVIICGLGGTGSQLVADAAMHVKGQGKGRGIVVIDRDPERALLSRCARQGAVFVLGDVTDERVLEIASAARAERVVFVTGSDEANTEGAHRLRQLVSASNSAPRRWWHRAPMKPPVAHVHVRRAGLAAMLNSPSDRGVEIRGFSVVEEAAMEVVWNYITPLRPRSRDETLHAVIVGFGPMARALAIRLAEFAHFENCRRCRMTIVHSSEEADEVLKFTAQYPAFFPPTQWGATNPWQPDPRMDSWAFNTFIRKREEVEGSDRGVAFVVNGGFMSTHAHVRSREFVDSLVKIACDERVIPLVFVCGDADEDNCTDAKYLHDELEQRLSGAKPGRVHVFSHVARRDAMAAFVTHKDDQAGAVTLHPFGLSRQVCTYKKLTSTHQIELARQILASYEERRNEQRKSEGMPMLPMTVLEAAATWEKRSNLSAAMHAPVKLAVMGMRLVDDGDGTEAVHEWPSIIEEMEHNRWMAERLLTGWRFGKPDNKQKQRLQLVAWSDLPKSEIKKDEDQKNAIKKFCAGRLSPCSSLATVTTMRAIDNTEATPLRIGWVGHRAVSNVDSVRVSIMNVLKGLMNRTQSTSQNVHSVGGLAQGADLLCAQAAVELGVPIHVVLLEAMGQQTGDATAVLAQAIDVSVVPEGLDDSDRHVALAEFMLERIDVLIAVWDGQEGRGAGGTADVVERARKLNKEVIVVEAQRA